MSNQQGEGEDFSLAFAAEFGSTANLHTRRSRDKRSGRSRSERKKPTVRDQQFNMRCSQEFKATAKALAEARHISIADLLDELVFAAAAKSGVKL